MGFIRRIFRVTMFAVLVEIVLYCNCTHSTQSINLNSFLCEFLEKGANLKTKKDYHAFQQELFNRYMLLYHHASSTEQMALDETLQELSSIPLFIKTGETLGRIPLSDWNKLFADVENTRLFGSTIDNVGNVGIIQSTEKKGYLLVIQSGLQKDAASYVAHIAHSKFGQRDTKFIVLGGLDIIFGCNQLVRSNGDETAISVSFILPEIGYASLDKNQSEQDFLRGMRKYCEIVIEKLREHNLRKIHIASFNNCIANIPDKNIMDQFFNYLEENCDEEETRQLIDEMKEKLSVKSIQGLFNDEFIEKFNSKLDPDNIKKIISWIRYALHTEVQAIVLSQLKIKIEEDDVDFVSLNQKNTFYSAYNPCHSCMSLPWIDSPSNDEKTPLFFYKLDQLSNNRFPQSGINAQKRTPEKTACWTCSAGTLYGLE